MNDHPINVLRVRIGCMVAALEGNSAVNEEFMNPRNIPLLIDTLQVLLCQSLSLDQLVHAELKNVLGYAVFVLLEKATTSEATPIMYRSRCIEILNVFFGRLFDAGDRLMALSMLPGTCSKILAALKCRSLETVPLQYIRSCLSASATILLASLPAVRQCDMDKLVLFIRQVGTVLKGSEDVEILSEFQSFALRLLEGIPEDSPLIKHLLEILAKAGFNTSAKLALIARLHERCILALASVALEELCNGAIVEVRYICLLLCLVPSWWRKLHLAEICSIFVESHRQTPSSITPSIAILNEGMDLICIEDKNYPITKNQNLEFILTGLSKIDPHSLLSLQLSELQVPIERLKLLTILAENSENFGIDLVILIINEALQNVFELTESETNISDSLAYTCLSKVTVGVFSCKREDWVLHPIIPMLLSPLVYAVTLGNQMAFTAVETLAKWSQAESTQILIATHFPALIDQLLVKIQMIHIYPEAPKTLLGILKYSKTFKDADLTSIFLGGEDGCSGDFFEQILENLAVFRSAGYESALLECLNEMACHICESLSRVSVVSTESADDTDDPKIDARFKFIDRIVRISTHFILSEHYRTRILALETITTGIIIMNEFPSSKAHLLYPLVHWVWQHTISRFRDPDIIVARKAKECLEKIICCAGNFVSDRVTKPSTWNTYFRPFLASERFDIWSLLRTAAQQFDLPKYIKDDICSFLRTLGDADCEKIHLFLDSMSGKDPDWIWYLMHVCNITI